MLIRLKRCTGFILLLLLTINSIFLTNIYANTNSLTTPEVILFSVFGDSLFFEWKPVDGATSYDVKVDDVTINTSDKYFAVENITKSKTYAFSIRSKNSNSTGAWSEVSSIIPSNFVQKTRYSIAQNGQIEGKYIPRPKNSQYQSATMSMMNGTTSAQTSSANTQNRYIIYTAEDLYNICNDLDGYYELANDIDLEYMGWSPVGDIWGNPFTGTFDGKGHTIRNFYIEGYNYIGLFGTTYNVEIKNLTLENIEVNAHSYSGTLIGSMWGGKVLNCSVIGESYVSGKGGRYGLIAEIQDQGIVENCFVAISYIEDLTYVNDGTVLNSFCDSDLSSIYSSEYSRTTAELMTQSTFVGWDFENVWDIQEGVSYPFLRKQSQTETSFKYDRLGRLIEVVNKSGQKVTYTYDAVGNLLTVTKE